MSIICHHNEICQEHICKLNQKKYTHKLRLFNLTIEIVHKKVEIMTFHVYMYDRSGKRITNKTEHKLVQKFHTLWFRENVRGIVYFCIESYYTKYKY